MLETIKNLSGRLLLKGNQIGISTAPVLIILIGVALHTNSLNWGFLYDDFIHQGVFRYSEILPGVQPWDLYDYGWYPEGGNPLQKAGLFPWWTSEDWQVRFFRPVTSLSIFLDFLVYGKWAAGYHATNLLLYAVLLSVTYRFYIAIGSTRRAALWALAFFSFHGTHLLPVCWIANRVTIVVTLFTVLTLFAYHNYRKTNRSLHLLISLLCFLLACGAKESGLICLPLVFLYHLFVDRSIHASSFSVLLSRLFRTPSLWIFILVAGLYLGAYILAGRGAHSNLYSVPWLDTANYLKRLITLVPLAFSSLFFGISSDIVFSRPQLTDLILALSLPLLALLVTVSWARLRSNPLAGFGIGWTLLALMPVAGVTLSDRLLMTASLGSALFSGLLIHDFGSVKKLFARRKIASLILLILLVTFGLLTSIPLARMRAHVFYTMASTDREAIANAEIPTKDNSPRAVFLLSSPSTILAMTMLPTWSVLNNDPGIFLSYLQMAQRRLEWRRESDTTAIITFGEPLLLEHRYESLFHTKEGPPPPGTKFETAEFTATVLEVGLRGIRSARFEFARSLNDPSYSFLAWQGGRLARMSPPRIGQTLQIDLAKPAIPYTP